MKVRIIDWPPKPKRKPQTIAELMKDEDFRRKIDSILAEGGIPFRCAPMKKGRRSNRK